MRDLPNLNGMGVHPMATPEDVQGYGACACCGVSFEEIDLIGFDGKDYCEQCYQEGECISFDLSPETIALARKIREECLGVPGFPHNYSVADTIADIVRLAYRPPQRPSLEEQERLAREEDSE
jgi:hypothetical protein